MVIKAIAVPIVAESGEVTTINKGYVDVKVHMHGTIDSPNMQVATNNVFENVSKTD